MSKTIPIPLFDSEGKKREVEIDQETLQSKASDKLQALVVRVLLSKRHKATASTKTRAEVRGGGRKPWRQKGTGRARAGSIRAPHWVGGGVAHGPKPIARELKIPKKWKRLVLKELLKRLILEGSISLTEKLSLTAPKTKLAVAFLEKLEVKPKTLVVVAKPEEKVTKAFRNIPGVMLEPIENLKVIDILTNDHVLMEKEAFEKIRKELKD